MDYSAHQWLVLITSLLASMFCGMVYSLQAPFYPAEAEKKGIEASQYGFVFGVYEVGIFVASFFCSTKLLSLGTNFVFIAGIFLEGSSCFLFGFLSLIHNGTIFFAYSILLRIIESFGQAGVFTAMTTTCSLVFPDSVATIVSLTQTFFGLGMIIGPSIGGILYEVGGFLLPFTVVGVILWLCTLLTCFTLCCTAETEEETNQQQQRNGGIIEMLKIPSVWMGMMSVIVGNLSIGFIQATLEPHIRQFELSARYLGLVFILSGVAYSIASPLWGKVCDKGVNPRVCMLTGSLLIILCFSLIGPFPFIPAASPKLYLVIAGLILIGIGNGGMFTPGLVCICKSAFSNGYPDNSATYGLASGLWMTSFAVGGAVGPAVAGILFDAVGFRIGSLFVICVNLIVAMLCFIQLVRASKCCVQQEEEDSTGIINAVIDDNTEDSMETTQKR